MFDPIMAGLAALLTPQAMLFIAIGVIYGLIVGVLPGLGGVVAMALLLPFTYGFEIGATLGLLLGAHIATIWGSSVTSILFNVPGAAKSLPLCFDGYPMTQNGQATRALAASATSALLGGIIGAVFLALSIPFVRPIMLALGPSEYFMMAVWGLTIIAIFSEGSLMKGLIAGALGVMIAFIGMDPVTATARFTFGSVFLLDGISFAVAMIGLFAVAEMMKLYVKGGAILDRNVARENSTVMEGVTDVFRHWWLVLRSSLLGLWIGVLPGVGASVGGIAAYAQAVQTSKTPERFGKGAVEGVIAPDATLGANEGGGIMPTVAFGIPGGESMAILLVAFINLGVVPGPQMLSDHLDLVFTLVWIIVIASVPLRLGTDRGHPDRAGSCSFPRTLACAASQSHDPTGAVGLLHGGLWHAGPHQRRDSRCRLRRARLPDGQVPLLEGESRDRHGAGGHDRAQSACVADVVWRLVYLYPPGYARHVHLYRRDHCAAFHS